MTQWVHHKGTVLESRSVLSKHSKSFRWAAWFLPADAQDDAAVVYAMCRLIDDLADEQPDAPKAKQELEVLRLELLGERDPRTLTMAFLDVVHRRDMELGYVFELIDGVLSDLDEVRVETDEELLRYCYRVAGTVGLMMCSVLGVRDRRALAHAIDLGVAMQLTNICRDVLEDANDDRVYLPQHRLQDRGTSTHELLRGQADPGAVSAVVCDILALAEVYYRSADLGMAYIPARSRLAIVVAARLYRAIGVKLLSMGGHALAGRTWVGSGSKIGWTLNAAFFYLATQGVKPTEPHNPQLHDALHGLPGAAQYTFPSRVKRPSSCR